MKSHSSRILPDGNKCMILKNGIKIHLDIIQLKDSHGNQIVDEETKARKSITRVF